MGSRILLILAVFLGGVAALSWEVIWQLKLSLALGLSDWGTALTLAMTMAGLAAGSWAMGRLLSTRLLDKSHAVYACCEMLIGVFGLLLSRFSYWAETLDAALYHSSPRFAPFVYLVTLLVALGPPTLAMGATLPCIGLLARRTGVSMSILYGLNTLGGAVGCFILALFLVPRFGVSTAGITVSAGNFVAAALLLMMRGCRASEEPQASSPAATPSAYLWLALVSGFSTLALEVAWFRALRAAFRSTTETFAILLAAVLIALGIGARLVPYLRSRYRDPAVFVGAAGVLALLSTPIIERVDMVSTLGLQPIQLTWTFLVLGAVGPTMLCLGISLPWILDAGNSTQHWGRLYSLNTIGAVLGALLSAWILLPTLGFVPTAYCVGLLLGLSSGHRTTVLAALVALVVAYTTSSGIGTTRVVGHLGDPNYKVLAYRETPATSVAVVDFPDAGGRGLIIDGFHAATQTALGHYMAWMGHLPLLLQEHPHNALVICFGTGQTANAVRRENPERLTIVDINRAVFGFAQYFDLNQRVLNDPRVEPIVMDGRAFLRRSAEVFDAITLEPMPPNFAGVNSLYSREFYELAKQRMSTGASIAQWVTFRLVSPRLNASVVKTFVSVFPDSFLWIDPLSKTGIVVGRKDSALQDPAEWPGLKRTGVSRDLAPEQVRAAVALRGAGLNRYADFGNIITDDNQLLAYGPEIHAALTNEHILEDNLELVSRAQAP